MNQSNQLAAIVAPIVTGYLSTWDHSFRSAFLVAGIVLLAGIASYIFLLGRIERVQLPNIDDGLIA
jgi:MFS family permease